VETWHALVLGLVEGFTEFLPVSSTGHLLVAQRLLGIQASEAANAFVVCVQSGALLAVLALYTGRLRQLVRGAVGADADGRRLLLRLLLAFAPAAVAGLLFDERIEETLFGPWPVVGAWIAGGLVILLLGSRLPWGGPAHDVPLERLGARAALLIGLAQCLALWPGTSRSLVTIVAAALVGLSVPAAIEFSFLLGALTLGAATGWTLLHHGRELVGSYGPLDLALGFAAAFVAAVLSVRWMVAWLGQHGLQLFGWWRVLLGGAVAAALLAGVL
jgi:undecaprenyl-diphosphatase